ncbi:MAG: urease accessory protein UreE [Hyphomicrobiaceae bacterium]
MIRAIAVETAGNWGLTPAGTVVLDFDQRHRRRIAMTTTGGLEFLLDLEKAHRLREGDALVLEDGRHIAVTAAPEPLAEIRCDDLRHLIRVAWHLGNRHLPTMLDGERLVIRRDHVIEDMVRGLGAAVAHIDGPFNPEGGAYGGGHHHHHGDDDGSPTRPKRPPPVWSPKEGTP